MKTGGNSPSKPTGITKAAAGKQKGSPTKKKNIKTEDSAEESMDVEEPVTPPPKRLPARKARVEKFTEESEDENENEELEPEQENGEVCCILALFPSSLETLDLAQ